MSETTNDRVVSKLVFEHKGVQVEERIYNWGVKTYKLTWTLFPFDQPIIAGKKNPIVHFDFKPSTQGPGIIGEAEAREHVQIEFDNYHKLGVNDGNQTTST